MPSNTTRSSSDEAYEPRAPHRRLALDENRHVITHGLKTYFWQDIYHIALTVGWPLFFAVAALLFLLLNFGFAVLYLLGHQAIANQAPAGLLGAFFFSVETLATVGYGDMHPDTIYGHSVATLEIFVGMSGIALTTGMIFARFSRPHARILFAKCAVVRPIDGRMTLMVRAANARQNVIVEAKARMRLMRSETTPEGFYFRKVLDLPLIREQHPIFLLGWSLMHVIDEESPLFGQTLESLKASNAELMLMVEGLDETTAQPMQARYAWPPECILWQHQYVDLMFERDGETHLDYGKFHDVAPL
ncbi:MAG: inward rectifier potassium channel [Caballeronia sp.]|jgi:inward rectifier potassium channel|nr:inward rectifier potassium channel [Caballeronia sp.]